MFLSNGSVFRVPATRLKKKRKYRYRLFPDSMWHGGELTESYAFKKEREREKVPLMYTEASDEVTQNRHNERNSVALRTT